MLCFCREYENSVSEPHPSVLSREISHEKGHQSSASLLEREKRAFSERKIRQQLCDLLAWKKSFPWDHQQRKMRWGYYSEITALNFPIRNLVKQREWGYIWSHCVFISTKGHDNFTKCCRATCWCASFQVRSLALDKTRFGRLRPARATMHFWLPLTPCDSHHNFERASRVFKAFMVRAIFKFPPFFP